MSREWQQIVSGERRDFSAGLLRALLAAGVPAYAAAVHLRSWMFDRGLKGVHRADVPIVSVGNLTTGGTGKTPVVAWVVGRLAEMGRRPGILSRGYRALNAEGNDEKLVLDRLCPGVPHVQNPDRVAGAHEATTANQCDVLVLDDGFQHRRLARDLDVVLIDALTPWGYGSLLPRGLMREPRSALRRADSICLTRVDQVDSAECERLKVQIRAHTAASIAEIAFRPIQLRNAVGEVESLAKLQSAEVGACCGIGNPQAFLRTLTALGAPPSAARFRAFPDHHHFTQSDLQELATWVNSQRVDLLVVTQKDLVKIPQPSIGRAKLWALEIGVDFLSGEAELCVRLHRTVANTVA